MLRLCFPITISVLLLASTAPVSVCGQAQPTTGQPVDSVRAMHLFVRGLTSARTGDPEKAIEQLGQAARFLPTEPAILLSLSEAHAATHDLDAAIFYARRATELSREIEYIRHLARILARAGRLEEAEAAYDRLVKEHPDDSDGVFERARLKVRVGREAEAATAFERLIQLVGDDRLLRTRLLQLYGRLEDLQGVERTLRALIDLDPAAARYHLMLSDFLIRNGRKDDARRTLERALEQVTDDFEIIAELGELYRASGQRLAADSLSELVTDVTGLSAGEIAVRAEQLYARAISDTAAASVAIDVLNKGLEIDGSNYAMLTMLGDLRYRRHEHRRAAELLKRALAVDARNADVWLQTTLALLNSDQPQEAAELGEEGVLLFPGRVDLLEATAHGYLVVYENDRAIELYEKALALLADDELWSAGLAAEAHASLGFLYSRREAYDLSDDHYRRALRIDSTHAFALNNFAYSLASRGLELEKAVDLARRAVTLQGEEAPVLDTLGWILFLLGRPDEAHTWLLRAHDLDSTSATVLEHLGDVEERMGLHDSAVERWSRALEIRPDSGTLKRKLDTSSE